MAARISGAIPAALSLAKFMAFSRLIGDGTRHHAMGKRLGSA
jgi:hypothetical protein